LENAFEHDRVIYSAPLYIKNFDSLLVQNNETRMVVGVEQREYT